MEQKLYTAQVEAESGPLVDAYAWVDKAGSLFKMKLPKEDKKNHAVSQSSNPSFHFLLSSKI